MSPLLIYLIVINLFASVITIYDKVAAIKYKWRIPEYTLLSIGFIGGALGMLMTMNAIHHKTRHQKFMIGLAVMIILHILLLAYAYEKMELTSIF